MSKSKTLLQIQEEIEEFVQKRDRVVHKSPRGYRESYQSKHKQSPLGNYPICHVRPAYLTLTNNDQSVDCIFCLKVMKEYE